MVQGGKFKSSKGKAKTVKKVSHSRKKNEYNKPTFKKVPPKDQRALAHYKADQVNTHHRGRSTACILCAHALASNSPAQ